MKMWEKLNKKSIVLAAIFSVGLLVTGCQTLGSGGKSVEELTSAAEAGDPNASLKLADLYFNGRGGLEKNFVEAEKWYKKAAQQFEANK